MSDAMTNTEADEVLASIRRLVAETHGHRPEPVRMTPPTFQTRKDVSVAPKEELSVKAEAEAEALVLTPAFRVRKAPVEDGVAEDVVAEAADAPKASAPAMEPLVLEAALEPLILSPELAVHVPEAAPDDTPTDETPTLETLIAEEMQATHEAEAVAEDFLETAREADWAEALDDTPDEEAARHASRLTLEQRIAELEAAVGAQAMDWEPDGSEDLEAEIPREMPRGFAEPGARVLHFRARQAAPKDEAPKDDAPQDNARDEAVEQDANRQATNQSGETGLHDKDEGAMSQGKEAKPVSDEIDDVIHDAEVIEETPAPQTETLAETEIDDLGAEPEVAHDPDPRLEEELALAGYADEDIMDEEALRDLVAQVIREELQGELGQRITRNVRLLVRREVQRALTLREFE